ncbi:MAG: BamA/TamA family outer membrane protein [Draconibacterium sp.]|nr:BamA/TamA family outer membrane protein [Draconibacterium sp.]
MKKFALLFVFSLFFCSVFSQEEEVTKDGFNFGVLPTITYDTDLGFQYGGLVNLYHYGDGSRYPTYDHSLYFEISRFTKGSGINRFYYDSDRLIKGLQTSVDISYLSDQAYDFYGFNGYDAVVNSDWMDDESDDYVSRMFYKYDRKLFRFKVDLLGNLLGDKIKWAAGINLLNFNIGEVDLEKLNDGQEGDDLLPDVDGLYNKYTDNDIITAQEADGGFVPILKAGLVYDTRDNRPNPMKGIWTEAVFVAAPEFLGAESGFAKIKLTHRQYFTIVPDELSLVYRLAYQTTIGGHVPFYYQSQVITSVMKGASSEGLGGAKSLRGIRRNRIVGDGFFYGNIEARWKAVHFKFINNNFYLGVNGFMDFGQVTKKIDINSSDDIADYLDIGAEQMHFSYGAGLRIAMNTNFIIAIDYGFAADDRDGESGLYIGLNYLF